MRKLPPTLRRLWECTLNCTGDQIIDGSNDKSGVEHIREMGIFVMGIIKNRLVENRK
jgi:hypothetical protein